MALHILFRNQKLAKLPFTTRNDAELLIDGEATFRSILDGIDPQYTAVLDEAMDRVQAERPTR